MSEEIPRVRYALDELRMTFDFVARRKLGRKTVWAGEQGEIVLRMRVWDVEMS
jgi:hypothetical protein